MSRNQGGLLQYFFGRGWGSLISYQVLISCSYHLGEARLYSEEGSSIEQVETANSTQLALYASKRNSIYMVTDVS